MPSWAHCRGQQFGSDALLGLLSRAAACGQDHVDALVLTDDNQHRDGTSGATRKSGGGFSLDIFSALILVGAGRVCCNLLGGGTGNRTQGLFRRGTTPNSSALYPWASTPSSIRV